MHGPTKPGRLAVASRAFAFFAGLLLLVPAEAAAQPEHADSILHRNNCRLTEQVLLTGRPAVKHAWALDYVVTCGGQGGEILAALFQRHRNEGTRSAALNEIAETAIGFVDRTLALAATDIAADENAGYAARVQAFRVVYSQVRPEALVTYERISRSGMTVTPSSDSGAVAVRIEPAEADWVIDRGAARGEPLQPGDYATIQARLVAAENAAQQPGIREAARNTIAAVAAHRRRLSLCPGGTPAAVCMQRSRAAVPE